MRRGALVAAAAIALVIAVVVLLPRLAGPTAAAPSASVTSSPATSPTPTPTATQSPTATAAGRFVNGALGYSVQLPAPWRRSGCISLGPDAAPAQFLGVDGFTSVPVGEESYGDTGGLVDTVSVGVERNPDRLTAEAWARSPRMGSAQGQSVEAATLDGRAGVRIFGGALGNEVTLVAVDDLMYVVSFSTSSATDPLAGAMRGIVTSFKFVPRTAPPAASARPARSVEAVADGLADGFARKDVTALARLMGDCAISGGERAGFGSYSPERFALILRDLFAAGTTVVVRSRPIEAGPGYGAGDSVTVATTWTDLGKAAARVDLIIGTDGSFSYWRGMVRRLPQP